MQNLLQNGLEQITKRQNLSQSELEQITRMLALSHNKLEQIAKMGRIKNYNNMSKEGLLIVLFKLSRRLAELYKSKSDNAKIEETRKSLNVLRDKFSRSKIKEIRKEIHKIERKNETF